MPRPNPLRTIGTERGLAARIAFERERHGMSYEGLAVRMGQVGCATHASGLFKIEKGVPPRRITVNELIAFSRVFGIPIEELVVDPQLAASHDLVELIEAVFAAQDLAEEAAAQYEEALRKLCAVAAIPEAIACRGALGLWSLPADQQRLVEELLTRPRTSRAEHAR